MEENINKITELSPSEKAADTSAKQSVNAEKAFSPFINSVKYGLIRMSADFILIDLNEKARILVGDIECGADISDRFGKFSLKAMEEELKPMAGSVIPISLKTGTGVINAVACRENNGNIIVFIHPVFWMLTDGAPPMDFMKLASAASAGIIRAIKSSDREKDGKVQRTVKYSSRRMRCAFDENFKDRSALVSDTLESAVAMITSLPLKREIELRADCRKDGWIGVVNSASIQVFLIEVIMFLEEYCGGSKPLIEFFYSAESGCVKAFVKGSLGALPTKEHTCAVRIIAEIMFLADIGGEVELTDDGYFTVNALISARTRTLHFSEKPQYSEEKLWQYFNGAGRFYGLIGKKSKKESTE